MQGFKYKQINQFWYLGKLTREPSGSQVFGIFSLGSIPGRFFHAHKVKLCVLETADPLNFHHLPYLKEAVKTRMWSSLLFLLPVVAFVKADCQPPVFTGQ